MGLTGIQWTQRTWNPLKARTRVEITHTLADDRLKVLPAGTVGYHCERVSDGCRKCYACSGNRRMLPNWGTGLDYTRQSRDQVEMFLDDDVLREPLTWKKPQLVFPYSMTDLFGEFVPNELIAEVFRMKSRTPQHTYQVVTKRAARMAELMPRIDATFGSLPHVWIGVSVENRAALDRIEHLRRMPAWITRWVSFEPLLEDISGDLGDFNLRGIAWAVIGLESGPGARGDVDHAWRLLQRLRAAGIPVFVKQLGSRYAREHHLGDANGGDIDEFPPKFHVRQYPRGFVPPVRKARAA